jgi:hypothetical protein
VRIRSPRGGQWLSKGEEQVNNKVRAFNGCEPTGDWCGADAPKLSAKITEYWRERGYTNVTVYIQPLGRDGMHAHRSNLINGRPPQISTIGSGGE